MPIFAVFILSLVLIFEFSLEELEVAFGHFYIFLGCLPFDYDFAVTILGNLINGAPTASFLVLDFAVENDIAFLEIDFSDLGTESLFDTLIKEHIFHSLKQCLIHVEKLLIFVHLLRIKSLQSTPIDHQHLKSLGILSEIIFSNLQQIINGLQLFLYFLLNLQIVSHLLIKQFFKVLRNKSSIYVTLNFMRHV